MPRPARVELRLVWQLAELRLSWRAWRQAGRAQQLAWAPANIHAQKMITEKSLQTGMSGYTHRGGGSWCGRRWLGRCRLWDSDNRRWRLWSSYRLCCLRCTNFLLRLGFLWGILGLSRRGGGLQIHYKVRKAQREETGRVHAISPAETGMATKIELFLPTARARADRPTPSCTAGCENSSTRSAIDQQADETEMCNILG